MIVLALYVADWEDDRGDDCVGIICGWLKMIGGDDCVDIICGWLMMTVGDDYVGMICCWLKMTGVMIVLTLYVADWR